VARTLFNSGHEATDWGGAEIGDHPVRVGKKVGAGPLNGRATHVAESPTAAEIRGLVDADAAIVRKRQAYTGEWSLGSKPAAHCAGSKPSLIIPPGIPDTQRSQAQRASPRWMLVGAGLGSRECE